MVLNFTKFIHRILKKKKKIGNDFEKGVFRMKNLRKKVGVKLITNSEDYLKLVSKLVSFVL